ncbi:hypothetical protein WJX72_003001 [[Myrmecia] bisecta]|uniref:Uncharacterized protein n=1 Tax=[Myrmecia] bisecta TaxID=41462 RepID=A0AAW1P5H2_9CHLO
MVPRPAQWLLVLLLLASAVAAHRPWHPSSFWPWRQDPQQFVGTSLKVPKILHHVYMGGYKEYLAGTKRRPAVNVAAWRESCLIQHPDWTAMFWDEANAHRLLAEHYAWFLPTWARYGSTIARADAIRPFIMHRYGGLYLDLDVQCFRNGASFLTGYDVVLQASSGPWDKGTINCAMASVPEHPLWMVYAHLLPSKQQENDTLEATGPRVLAQAVAMHFDTKLPIKAGLHADADDTVVQVYPAGQWYLACMPPKDEPACSRLLIKALVTGELPLDRLAGHHRFHGTWYDAPHDDRLWEDLRATVLQSPRMGHQGAGQGLIQPAARPQPRSWRSWGLPKAGRSKTSRAQEANARRSNQ